jgi:hypothetical protein
MWGKSFHLNAEQSERLIDKQETGETGNKKILEK